MCWPPPAVISSPPQQADWPTLYALHCEVFDAVQNVLTAAGMRLFIKSPFHQITLRESLVFVLIAGIIVPVGTAFWGAAFTLSNHFGTDYWIEWRNLGVSNGVTAIVLGAGNPARRPLLCERRAPRPHRGRIAGGMRPRRVHRSRSDTSPSIACLRDRTTHPRSSMRPLPCSSGPRCASGSAGSAPRC
jgi:hypothetical protein